ncbi:hypothetical protein B0H17DRAFT_1332956 [Mycena rosella]|uniref:Polyketide synthase n=1 Tax=Mycena rosella TaxID=1033263 RepID=A0AAD7GFW3_MYCRO|nr:hypothetical protein B0H17DRAFT_1332956 [Mycena rosella]
MTTTMEPDGIAIVGLAAQLPSGTTSSSDLDYASFWDFLVNGRKAHEPLENVVPEFTQYVDNILSRTPRNEDTRSKVKLPEQGAFLKNATGFDNISLGISARDARNDIDAEGSFSWTSYSMANRISYALDLTGPSIHVDTACSSSLTALHLAIGAIEKGDCVAALVGAAQINRDQFEWTTYVQGGFLASDGICRPFDAAAGGFARGEGAVVVVLKPLKDAIRDHDHIYSVVLGSAINASGSGMPLNVPNGLIQQQCIHDAYKRANLNPRDADYVELHGTGTPVGDPIETNAAGEIFAIDRPALFGTVKGNIGHLEIVAFFASLVKACLIFEHGIIPPTVNFSNPTRSIDWDAFQIAVPVMPTPLGCRSPSGRSIISLSSFGVGGAIGHVVLQAPPTPSQMMTEFSTTPILFLVGGLSSNAVEKISMGVSQMGSDDPKILRECAVTLSRQARQLPWRKYFTIPASPRTPIAPAVLVPRKTFPLAFVFSGQGPQHLEMGRQLFGEYPVFRNTILDLDDVYRRVRGVSLIESTGLFGPSRSAPRITLSDFGWPVTITLSAIAMVQMALFDLLQSLGIVPDVMMGHSAGETAILYASGAGSKAMAMEIAIARGEAMSRAEGDGVGMAMVACNVERALQLITRATADEAGILEISCFNSQNSITVSGNTPLLDKIVALAKHEDIFAQRIRTMVPCHSSFMDTIKVDYIAKMENIFARYPGIHAPHIPVHSTSREDQFVEVFTTEYFWDNCRNAVLFSKAISDSLPSSPVFLEISCHAVLSSSILAQGVLESRVLCPMRRVSAKKGPSAASTEPEFFLDTLGHLSLLGVNSLDLSRLYGPSAFKSKLIEHPLAVRTTPPPKLLFRIQSTAENNGPLSTSSLRINKTSHPDLAEHVINGEPILASTGFVELLLESGANFLWDVEFLSILSLASASPLEIRLQSLDVSWSLNTITASQKREHARGFMDSSTPSKMPPVMDCESIFKRLPSLDFHDFYSSLEPLVSYGPRFQRIVRCHGVPLEAIAEIQGPTTDELSAGYVFHPAIMNACLHLLLHTDVSKEYSKDITYLPSRLEHFILYRRKYGAGNWFSHVSLRQWTPESRSYDVLIMDSSGLALCKFRNLTFQKFTTASPITVDRRFDLIYQPVVVNTKIPTFPTSFPKRADHHEIQLLFETLDSMAVAIISKSLSQHFIVGEHESRGRYLNFAHRALNKRNDRQLSPEILQDLRENWPQHFEITRRISTVHKSVFETPQRVVDVLYSDDLMAKFYSKSSQTSNVCAEATKVFSGVLESLRKSGKKSVRILEVGAGTGLFTYHLIDELKRNPDLLAEYTVTDISYALVAELARNIAYGSVIPKAYDISKDSDAQGIQSESYDVVIALHVLHAAPSVKACLLSLQKLLTPGGSLFIVELDGTGWMDNPGSVWYDYVFGSFQEWFGFTDGREHCALTPTTWRKQLEAVDFLNVQTCAESGGTGREFFFAAQKALSVSDSASDLCLDPRHIYSYEFGKEIELQARLRDLDTAASITVYFLAMRGRDGDAALGLCAALRQELPLCDIRLAVFESSLDFSTPIPLLLRHMGTFDRGENVMSFDRYGAAHVPRVVLSLPPSSPQQLGATNVPADPNFISVRVTQWAGMSHTYDGFVGQVAQSKAPNMSAGDFVGGVVEASSAELLSVHINNIISTSENSADPGQLMGTVVSSLITWPSSGTKARMAIAVDSEDLTKIIAQSVPTRIQLVLVDFKDPDISERLDILVSDSATYAQYPHLRRWIPRSGRVILWDELLNEHISQSYIGRIVANGCNSVSEMPPLRNGHIPHTTACIPRRNWFQPCRSRAAPPFRNDRAYILLGGVGGFGVDLAVWMYQHGARCLVLTGRDDLESLDAVTLAKVSYLNGQDDLNLRLEKCEAWDSKQMNVLLHSLPVPVAGCFHMTRGLSSAPFIEQTTDMFHAAYDSKLGVFDRFSAQVEMESLDFFVAISSTSGLVGIPGQSNYASACTALDGVLGRYPNAFSLITPCIVGLDRTNYEHSEGKDGLASISAEALFVCLEDGLRKLDDGPFNQYIPDFDWFSVGQHFVLPMTCRHLLSPNSRRTRDSVSEPQNEEGILTRVLELLEVSLSDFDVAQPLTVYGLDSISAAKLSSILRPYASFSQMQLLGGVTWAEIETQLQTYAQTDSPALGDSTSAAAVLLEILGISPTEFSPDIPLSSYGLDWQGASRLATALQPFMAVTQMQLVGTTTWAELVKRPPQLADTTAVPLVEICSGDGVPLIILPGGNGSMALFLGLRRHFKGPLWALQITESTPLESLEALVGFWEQQICAKRPHGPYRLAGYSASTLLVVALTKLMEDAGEEVIQLTFIDHCPALWAREETEALLRKWTAAEFRDMTDASVLDLLRRDPTTGEEAFANYQAAVCGSPDTLPNIRSEVTMTRAVVTLMFEFLQKFYPADGERSYSTFIGPFKGWLFSIKAPLAVLVAEHGIVHSAPGGAWPDLGGSRFAKAAKVYYISGVGHYGIFRDERVAQMLAM